LDDERFLEMTEKVNTNNAFVRLVLGKIKGNWCTRRGCTTCGGEQFREETLKDPEGLLKAIYELKREDVEHLDFVWEDCLKLALAHLYPLNPRRDEDPEIFKYGDELYYERSKRLYNMQMKLGIYKKERTKEERLANIAKDEEEKKAAAERKKESIRKYWEHVKSSIEARSRVMEKFNSLHSLRDKLAVIAEDKKRPPQYYPLDLNEVTGEELRSLDKEIVADLLERFALLRKKEWRSFYKRLLETETGRAV
jgi:hypothetical protein